MIRSYSILLRVEAGDTPPGRLKKTDRDLLDGELDQTMEEVARCDSFDSAEPVLQKLADLQEIMAKLAFKHEMELSRRQREIVYEYDRCDLLEVRQDVFRKIKNAEFPWCPDTTQ